MNFDRSLEREGENNNEIGRPNPRRGAAYRHQSPVGKSVRGQSLELVLEPKAGGRWYRDRGNGIGHLWGFVQVIKAPTLLELSGPMFMSYPCINHVEVKIEPASGGCRVALRHRAIGMIDPEHRKNVGTGWNHMLTNVRKDCE
jgi:hypothetical protein